MPPSKTGMFIQWTNFLELKYIRINSINSCTTSLFYSKCLSRIASLISFSNETQNTVIWWCCPEMCFLEGTFYLERLLKTANQGFFFMYFVILV